MNRKIFNMVSGLLVAAALTGAPQLTAFAQPAASSATGITADYSQVPDISKRFQEMDFLTAQEKDTLAAEKKEAAPLYGQISELNKSVEKISNRVMKDAEGLNAEFDALYSKNMKLWNKVYSEPYEGTGAMTQVQMVAACKSLTEAEKKSLAADAARMDAIDQAIEGYHAQVKTEAAEYLGQIDAAYEKLNKIYEKDASIWSKVFAQMDGK